MAFLLVMFHDHKAGYFLVEGGRGLRKTATPVSYVQVYFSTAGRRAALRRIIRGGVQLVSNFTLASCGLKS